MSLAQVEDQSQRMLFGAVGASLFLMLLASIDGVTRGQVSLPALVPPFGASVVIVFFTPDAAAARPWNVMVGHLVSASVAILWLGLLPGAPLSIVAALAVSSAALAMVLTQSLHPPGGATALLTVLLQPRLGAALMLCPVLTGALALVATRGLLDRSLAWRSARAATLSARIRQDCDVDPGAGSWLSDSVPEQVVTQHQI